MIVKIIPAVLRAWEAPHFEPPCDFLIDFFINAWHDYIMVEVKMTDEQKALHATIQLLKMVAGDDRENMLLDFFTKLLKESFDAQK